jgi:hypothetical protein
MTQGALGVDPLPAVGEGIGSDIQDAHDVSPLAELERAPGIADDGHKLRIRIRMKNKKQEPLTPS